tara:strand:+ start:963 stop:1400 length:438 start_codon:yes stop_codon:yes gene_type:complete
MKISSSSKKLILSVFVIATLLFSNLSISVNAQEIINKDKYQRLEKKVAEGYANKFCNAIGIGMSKDSALKLTILENNKSTFNPSLWFEIAQSGEKNLSLIDEKKMLESAAELISLDCGNAINLKGNDSIYKFKEELIASKINLAK